MQILFAHDGLNISKDHNCLLRCRRSKAAGGTCLFPESFSSSYSGLIIFLVPQESGLPINLHHMVDICWSPHLGSVISPPSHRFMLPAEKSQSALSAGIGQPQGARKCSNALCRKWGLVPMPHSKASMQGAGAVSGERNRTRGSQNLQVRKRARERMPSSVVLCRNHMVKCHQQPGRNGNLLVYKGRLVALSNNEDWSWLQHY
jgi:hypothetical protein